MMKRLLIATAVLALSTAPVFGQFGWSDIVPSPYTQTLNYIQIGGVADTLEEETRRDRYRDDETDQEDTSSSTQASPPPPPAKLTYAPSPARRSANLAKLKSLYLKTNNDPQAKAMFDQLFTTSIYSAVDLRLQSIGLSSANFADVMATHIAMNWQAANSVPDSNFPEANIIALAKQVRQLFSNDPHMRTLNDTQRQFAAEELMAQMLVAASMNDAGQTDPQMKQAAQSYGRAALKQFGFDYAQFDITAEGFTPRSKKRSDASDAVAGEEKALASATPSDAAAEGSPNYALIAGAAGAGLGLAFLIGKAVGKKG
jgi:hypothetical protein